MLASSLLHGKFYDGALPIPQSGSTSWNRRTGQLRLRGKDRLNHRLKLGKVNFGPLDVLFQEYKGDQRH